MTSPAKCHCKINSISFPLQKSNGENKTKHKVLRLSGLYADNDATFTLTKKRNVREGGREIEEAIKGSRLMITEITRRIKRKERRKSQEN